MAKSRLNQYKDRLSHAQIAEGMNAAIDNAKRLANAASLLLQKEDYALAASIAALSIEESGKRTVLRSLAVARNDQDVAQCWREYRSHTKKNVLWPLLQMFAEGARRLADFAPLFDEKAEHPLLLDQVKQIGFYTDCLGEAHWSVPADVIGEDLAKTLVTTAALLAEGRRVTTVEIDLWVKHVGPVREGPGELLEHGLSQWYKAMQEQGLAENGANAMEEFILRGIGQTDAHTLGPLPAEGPGDSAPAEN